MNNELWFNKNPAAGGYAISRSLRFNSSDSAYLSRTPASAGNRKTWTWAGWVKRSSSSSGTAQILFSTNNGSGTYTELRFANDYIGVNSNAISSPNEWVTNAVFRDFSAWLHLVAAVDTTSATASDRIKVYVNGVAQTFSQSPTITQNNDLYINAAVSHSIGRRDTGSLYFNGYLADTHFIDGQALDPTSFGEFDDNGIWQPKAFAGSYGTQGWHLEFADNSSNTATTLGKDTSPNGNNWTPNNLSVTAGAGNDSVVDVPTNGAQTDTGAGGEVRGNYCTWNPLAKGSNVSLSNGNLDASTSTTSGYGTVLGTIGMSSGKWYWEFTGGSGTLGVGLGIAQGNKNLTTYLGTDVGYEYYSENGNKYSSAGGASYGASWGSGDVIGVAFDADNGTLVFYKNGVSQGTAYTGLTSTPYFPAVADSSGTNVLNGSVNFGQRPFAYTAPSGFKALNTANLPAPVVTKPSEVMDVALYTGNNTARSITGLGFSPDFVWIKGRSGATDHALYDIVRGVQKDLVSNSTAAETTQSTGLTAFNSDGFSIGTLAKLNTNAATYAAWAWDAGSSTVTNTSGSITSSVRANATAGISIVGWTSNGIAGIETMGHGLGVEPDFIIVKNRDAASDWQVFHSSFGDTASDYLYLNQTAAKATSGATIWTRSSTTFGFRQSSLFTNGQKGIAMLFSRVVGYSSFGSYTGNGSADGPFVYTGFRPAFVLIKTASQAGNSWVIYDNKRIGYNETEQVLNPNLSGAEATYSTTGIDLLSNGFKLRGDSSWHGISGATVIYAAFAEHPFNFSRAR